MTTAIRIFFLGFLLAGTTWAVGTYLYVEKAKDQLANLVTTCTSEGESRAKNASKQLCRDSDLNCLWGQAIPICNPRKIEWSPNLGGIQLTIYQVDSEVSSRYAAVNSIAGFIFVLGILPLLWYFVLARIREIGNAVRGK